MVRKVALLVFLVVFGFAAFSATSSNATPYSAAVLADNPVSYWRLGDAGSLAIDEVGGRTLTYEGSPIPGQPGAIAGDPNTATGFSGDRSALSIAPDAGLQASTFSIEAWAKLTGACENQAECYQFIISQRSPTSAGYQFYSNNSNRWGIHLWDGSQLPGLEAPSSGLNEWAHLVGNYDGTNLSLFVNGSLIGSTPSGFSPTSARFTIGRNNSSDPRYPLNGVVDEVAYYNYALGADRVENHYQTGIGVIPEPSTALLLGLGLVGMAARSRP